MWSDVEIYATLLQAKQGMQLLLASFLKFWFAVKPAEHVLRGRHLKSPRVVPPLNVVAQNEGQVCLFVVSYRNLPIWLWNNVFCADTSGHFYQNLGCEPKSQICQKWVTL